MVSLLRPLMLDVVPSIQQTAALALGRLAEHSQALAEAVVKEDILPVLIRSLVEENVSRVRGKKVHINFQNEGETSAAEH